MKGTEQLEAPPSPTEPDAFTADLEAYPSTSPAPVEDVPLGLLPPPDPLLPLPSLPSRRSSPHLFTCTPSRPFSSFHTHWHYLSIPPSPHRVSLSRRQDTVSDPRRLWRSQACENLRH